jgi:hypothetical protein
MIIKKNNIQNAFYEIESVNSIEDPNGAKFIKTLDPNQTEIINNI